MATPSTLQEVLARWQQLRQQGYTPSAEELCADCPQWLETLKRHMATERIEVQAWPPADAGRQRPVKDHGTWAETFAFLGPPKGPDEIGWLGPYRVLKVLGRGGMGVVFLAEDRDLRRPVALKVLKLGKTASREDRQRFLREARAIAAVQHAHIISVYQVGQENEVPYLAMQYLDGETLERRLLREGRLPLNDVLRFGREMAQGLEAAHRRGLIHRDIKPSNIWLEAPGDRVKILDFGLVRVLGENSELTPSGYVVGTPECMAPEQARGLGVGPHSDLFSLGCILYRMGTGVPPFRGDNPEAAMFALVTVEQPPMRRLNPDLPSSLSDLVQQLLAKDPANRPPSAEALVAYLQALEDEQPRIVTRRVLAAPPSVPVGALRSPAPMNSRISIRRWLMLFGTGMVLGVLGVLAWMLVGCSPSATDQAKVQSARAFLDQEMNKWKARQPTVVEPAAYAGFGLTDYRVIFFKAIPKGDNFDALVEAHIPSIKDPVRLRYLVTPRLLGKAGEDWELGPPEQP